MTDETIEQRIERAQSQHMEVSLVDTDPVIVQVYNEESDRIHTVVPDSIHCSCEDHTYRDSICKHMIELLQQEGHIGEITREALKDRREEIQVKQADMQSEMDALQEEREQISDALTALDLSHMREETVGDIIDGIQAEAEARAGGADEDDSDEESPFEQMVADLAGDAE